ncbi:hypothetical protein U9M48_040547 [Paspalum notatum var. saurae]|uniref:Uncharacterized protein n=1 Tax=Paspalum notatum var. saurae TaxID=547442 RepID=A0AAQ3URC5_PASNO
MDLRNIGVYSGEDHTGFDQQPNAMINEQHVPEEQAGIVQQENHPHIGEDDIPAQVNAANDDIFDFPMKNQLIDLDSDDSFDI